MLSKYVAEYTKGNSTDWFFISKMNMMGKSETRHKRDGNDGYWHQTVASIKIDAGEGLIGKKTSLTYFLGKRPHGIKTNWLMHEYWISQSPTGGDDVKVCMRFLAPK